MTREDYYWEEEGEKQKAMSDAQLEAIEEEHLIRWEMQQLYQPNHKTAISPDGMPRVPIAPDALVSEVVNVLSNKGVTISNDTPKMIEDICKVFNFIIAANGVKLEKSFAYPAQTGSGKSLSLQVYVSMLKEHSSLIIVSKVSEALKYCEFINTKSKDPNYARCYYSISLDNPASPLRVSRNALNDYRCIVITHSMFKQVNKDLTIDIDLFKLYKTKQRDLIVIDEGLSFYEEFRVSQYECEALYELFIIMGMNSSVIAKFNDELVLFGGKIDLLFESLESSLDSRGASFCLVEKHSDGSLISLDEIDRILLLVEHRKKELITELRMLGIKENQTFIENIGFKIEKLLNTLKAILQENCHYFKYKKLKMLVRINHIANKLGASAILDATATINRFYAIANRYGSYIGSIHAASPRQYSNLTIHKAIGFKQSRAGLYKGRTQKEIDRNASMYASFAHAVLEHSQDKLLIICHKEFKQHLGKQCSDPRIVFTHWGDHVGKNDWSDCNKVMVVGWNFLNAIEHINSMINAVGELDVALDTINQREITEFEYGQLADDLVQGVMRSKARIIDTLDSDCSKTDVYLFYEDRILFHKVLDIVHSQFPQSTLQEWTPAGALYDKKTTNVQQNIEMTIDYLKSKKETHQELDQSSVIKEIGIAKQTFGRMTKKVEFKMALEKQGFALIRRNGKNKCFIIS